MKRLASEIMHLGLKVTPQRLAILDVLEGKHDHPTAESIYLELFEKYPGISHTTIYNTLERLVEAGKIRELDIDPNKRRFDVCMEPHDHFYCKVCGNVYDVVHDPSVSGNDSQNGRSIEGHHVETVNISFKGICKHCLEAAP